MIAGPAMPSEPLVPFSNRDELLISIYAKQGRTLDDFPHVPAFDQVVCPFNAQAGLSLTPHEVWRIVARLAK